MQQILLKTARDNLRKRGVVEFEYSDSETSEAEPQGKVDTRTKKRKRSSKEQLRPKPTRGGSSRGTNKLSPTPTRGQNNSRAASRGDHHPPSKRSKGGLIGPGVTQTLSTGEKDLHLELSGAGIVGKHVIVMTTIAPAVVVLKLGEFS